MLPSVAVLASLLLSTQENGQPRGPSALMVGSADQRMELEDIAHPQNASTTNLCCKVGKLVFPFVKLP